MKKIQQFKEEIMSETEEQKYLSAAFNQLYSDQLDQQLRSHGIYRNRKTKIMRITAFLAAAAVALLVVWIGFAHPKNGLSALATQHISNARVDYIEEVRKGTDATPSATEWGNAMSALKAGQYEQARSLLESSGNYSPAKKEFYIGLCALLQTPPALSDAIQHLNKAEQMADDKRDCQWLKAIAYIQSDNKTAAIAILQEIKATGGNWRKKDIDALLEALIKVK